MAKVKNKAKKKHLSDRKTKSDHLKKKVMNPFEVHVNRQKYDVLGRKSKHDKGLPGIARAKAINKRKKTLLQEYKVRSKANQFLDRRIGEKNRAMTTEDRIMARFTAERVKMHNKKTIFNLTDDEVLTHRGQTLNEIEKFEDPRSDDEDEKEKLDADFVEDAHFGGGVLKKSEDQSSRKDLIDQLIAESKKRKAERQRAREQTIELTEKLDTEWKDLLPLVSASKSVGTPVEQDSKPDSYDTVMRQLKFETRGKPCDRLKSEEEMAKEEKEQLEKLEAERLRRMRGELEDSTPQTTHRSADALDDGFVFESDEEVMMTYNEDGQLENPVLEREISRTEAVEEDRKDVKNSSDNDEDNSNSSSSSSSSDEESDSLSDLKNASESGDEDSPEGKRAEDESQNTVEQPGSSKNDIEQTGYSENTTESSQLTTEQHVQAVRADLLVRKAMMDQARKELPYTFRVPESYEELQRLLSGQSYDHKAVVLERMIKCNHPSLGEGYKDKLANLFAFLLQHLQDEATSVSNCFALLDRIVPHLYDLSHVSPDNASHCMAEVIREKQQDLRSHPRVFLGLDTLVFLKLVSLLFPTSDFRHPVVTPALVLMCQMLHQCRIKTPRDVAVGLYLATLVLEYTVLSRRFSPSAIHFLHRTVCMAVPGATRNLLVLQDGASCSSRLMNLDDLTGKCSEDFKVAALHTSVKLLLQFCDLLQQLPVQYHIFQPVLRTLQQVQIEQYPGSVSEDLSLLVSRISASADQKLQYLVAEKKKPKALRLYEPRIEVVFDRKKRQPMGKERQDQEKLLHKYKREMKGAVREIRRDKVFLAKLQLKQTLQNDMERKQKVREIFGSAAMQQGELRKLKRKK